MQRQARGTELGVCLLHDYREAEQPSMKLYADRLGAALAAEHVRVSHLRVEDVLPASLRGRWLIDRVDSYLGRYVVYPLHARRARADLFHVVDHAQGYLVPLLDPRRTIVTCHDVMLMVLASGRLGARPTPKVATTLFRASIAAMRRARRIIAVSEQTRRDLIDLAGADPDRIDVVFSGLNLQAPATPPPQDQTRRRLGLPDGRPLVLHVGYTGFYKNVEGVLDVVARLRQRGLDVLLARAGQPLTPAQRARAEALGLSRDLRELGHVPASDLPALYAAADVLLFPSLYEGFGWPPLEAMACGTPVVCSRAGALGEVVGDAALTAAPDAIDALADHVAAAITDRALAADLRARGLARAALFDWSRTAARVREIYERVLGE